MKYWLTENYRIAHVGMHFDSVHELVTQIRDPESRPYWFTQASADQLTENVNEHLSRGNSRDWYTFVEASHDALIDRVTGGWPEGVAQLRRALGAVEVGSHLMRNARKRTRGRQGDELDIHRVYRGDLERAWSTMRPAEKPGAGKAVTIVCNLGAHSGIEAHELFWRGAVSLHLSETLLSRGHPVQILAAIGGHDIARGPVKRKIRLHDAPKDVELVRGQIDHDMSVTLKAYQDPIDHGRIASMVCTGAGYRAVSWVSKVMSTALCARYIDSGWGYPKPLASPPALQNYDGAVIMVPGSITNEHAAIEFIRDKMQEELVA